MTDPAATVVAIATPPGRGGIGCVRLSGTAAAAIGRSLFEPRGRARPEARPGAACFGRLLGGDGAALDHGYAVYFEGRAAYSGEPTLELWCHGSPAVLAALVDTALQAGAEPAGPGEFTYRALRSGRIDLARAEAVRDLVAARTVHQARVAFAQVEGALSRRLRPLRERLVELIARGEAAVEFVDESETHLPAGSLTEGIGAARDTCAALLGEFRGGRLVREGATVTIAGPVNAGKSSLFNRLLAEERAIVTDVPGTTRDTLEGTVEMEGVPVTLVDTAGEREASDPVETEGQQRARRARAAADLVVYVLDASGTEADGVGAGAEPSVAPGCSAAGEGPPESVDRADRQGGGRRLVVRNKIDLPGATAPAGTLGVSARTGEGIERLRAAIRERLIGRVVESPVLTNARHAAGLRRAAAGLEHADRAAREGWSEELVLEDLRLALRAVGEITGEFCTDELYERIFSTFCIGK